MRFAHEKDDTSSLPGCREKRTRVLVSYSVQTKPDSQTRWLTSYFQWPVSHLPGDAMQNETAHERPPVSDRLSRAQGRKARRHSATAKLTRDEHLQLEKAAKSEARLLASGAGRHFLQRLGGRLSPRPLPRWWRFVSFSIPLWSPSSAVNKSRARSFRRSYKPSAAPSTKQRQR